MRTAHAQGVQMVREVKSFPTIPHSTRSDHPFSLYTIFRISGLRPPSACALRITAHYNDDEHYIDDEHYSLCMTNITDDEHYDDGPYKNLLNPQFTLIYKHLWMSLGIVI
jgi:hypothetical protein